MRPLPGPVREEDTEARVTGVLLGFMWVTITGAAVAAIALAFIMRRARQPGELMLYTITTAKPAL